MSTVMEKASEPFGLEHDVVDEAMFDPTAARFREGTWSCRRR